MKRWPFEKVLIANRGEIAMRIIRSVHALGLHSVAVFSDADRAAPHVLAADEAVYIGPSVAAESYLQADKILAAAQRCGAGAVHPGYGFLAENSGFADACAAHGLVFVGPSADAIRDMGDKRLAKERMLAAGVPCIPGYLGQGQDVDAFVTAARDIGFPVMVKAAAGGGGRGMRLVENEAALAAAVRSAASEALNAFGDGTLYLEKAVIGARHVEIQVIADSYGNALHLGERDCSVQRRHQKIVEESPSPAVTPELRARMAADAIAAVKAIGYVNAGTIEFLLDAEGNYYFLEMNTRIQVEHPVTEMVTGIDLVELQLRIAAGEELGITQEEISFDGHAIEVRLCAEDTAAGFMPQTGKIVLWSPAESRHVRVDSGVITGQEITPYYDSMIAKIIAHGRNREEARRRLALALEKTTLVGLKTNKDYLVHILRNEAFVQCNATTDFIDHHGESLVTSPPDILAGIAALLLCWPQGMCVEEWRRGGRGRWSVRFSSDQHVVVEKIRSGDLYIAVGDSEFSVSPIIMGPHELVVEIDSVTSRFQYSRHGDRVEVSGFGASQDYADISATLLPGATRKANDGQIKAPISGRVVQLCGQVGDSVTEQSLVAVIEAMKMEYQLHSRVDGVIQSINVKEGDQVTAQQILAIVEPNGNEVVNG